SAPDEQTEHMDRYAMFRSKARLPTSLQYPQCPQARASQQMIAECVFTEEKRHPSHLKTAMPSAQQNQCCDCRTLKPTAMPTTKTSNPIRHHPRSHLSVIQTI